MQSSIDFGRTPVAPAIGVFFFAAAAMTPTQISLTRKRHICLFAN